MDMFTIMPAAPAAVGRELREEGLGEGGGASGLHSQRLHGLNVFIHSFIHSFIINRNST